ncbi:MAG: exodeoxyribonuclease VII large subunit [Planctomycetota bacterium]|nr:exodeoxyribonuclease VII large subunit [Planctomycetota bacterium]
MTGSIELDPDGKNLQIRFPYRPDLVDEVKAIPGRRWDRAGKLWRVPTTQVDTVVTMFMRHGFTMTADVTSLLAGTQGTAPVDEESEIAASTDITVPDALSISDLNQKVKDAIAGAFPETIWVVGELTDYDKNQDRQHVFFTLVEKRGDTIDAQVSVAMFERTAKTLRTRLANQPEPMTLADGIEIRVLVRVDLYPRSGRYQLIVEDIDASFTLGKLALGREEILRELKEKGLDQQNRVLPMPVPALRVGVLTSHGSDGWNDFLAEMKSSRVGFKITSYDVRVQGELLKPTVLQGLRYFDQRREDFDVLCIIRGGGSRTDLAWFDEREVALAVARHPLKIVCGIGHQRDISVLDLIAHSEKTPTAVADFFIEQVRSTREVLQDLSRCLVESTKLVLRAEEQRLSGTAHDLRRHVQNQLIQERQTLRHCNHRLMRGSKDQIRSAYDLLVRRSEQVRSGVLRRIEGAAASLRTQQARHRLLDPTRVLQRGYTLVRNAGGGILKGVADLSPEQTVAIQFRDGRAGATIDHIEQDQTSD